MADELTQGAGALLTGQPTGATTARRDTDLRIEALRMAIGSDTPAETVTKAELYFKFLKGESSNG